MMISFNGSDVRRLTETLYVLDTVRDVPAVQSTMLPALGRLVGSDVGVLTMFDPVEPSETALLWPSTQFGVADFDGYAELLDLHPFVGAAEAISREPSVRISDLVTLRQWQTSGIYLEHHRRLGADDQLACMVPGSDDRLTAVIMSRQGSGFTTSDRDLFAIAQAHIARAVRRALASSVPYRALHVGRSVHWVEPAPTRTGETVLTGREWQVLSSLEQGWTSSRTARALGVSPRTVEKHVQNIHRKLGVGSSIEAVTLWRSDPTFRGTARTPGEGGQGLTSFA